MTMVIAAHLGDCILIAADKRGMNCDLETGKMTHETDAEQKIKLWNLGAVAGTGETVFLDRVAQYFINYREKDGMLRQMDAIRDELTRRMEEGVPPAVLQNNDIIFSVFNGEETKLYTINTHQFFHHFEQGAQNIIRVRMDEVKHHQAIFTCFNIPADLSNFVNFQKNLKSAKDFDNDQEFIIYYITRLKEVFATQSTIDPSITPTFDLYIQSCVTGESIATHVSNFALSAPISDNLNYWNKFRNL